MIQGRGRGARRKPAVRGAAIRNSGARRPRSVRRSTPRLSPVRAIAALVMICCLAAMYGVTATSAFAVRTLTLSFDGSAPPLTTEGSVRSELGLASAGPNVFLLATDRLAAELLALPAIESATVVAGLPDALQVRVVERQPILAWLTPGHQFLVDRDGLLIADAGPPESADPTLAAAVGRLPEVTDRRSGSASLAVGQSLDPVDLDVATRLGSLAPADVGSAAAGLGIAVDDTDGYTIVPEMIARPTGGSSGTGGGDAGSSASPNSAPVASASPSSPPTTSSPSPNTSRNPSGSPRPSTAARTSPAWTAVFGFYTPTIRRPDLIPGQVRVLRSLLLGRENRIDRIIVADDRSGTYTER